MLKFESTNTDLAFAIIRLDVFSGKLMALYRIVSNIAENLRQIMRQARKTRMSVMKNNVRNLKSYNRFVPFWPILM